MFLNKSSVFFQFNSILLLNFNVLFIEIEGPGSSPMNALSLLHPQQLETDGLLFDCDEDL